tara:strand:+ start:661 stop:873 length:213 start_codon:yes stop_codon:yes gene_type:complete
MKKATCITYIELDQLKKWINSDYVPVTFDVNTIEGILIHWRADILNFTDRQEQALLNVYNSYVLKYIYKL